MLNNKLVKGGLLLGLVCLLAGLASCGTSRKMGCPMQFSRAAAAFGPVVCLNTSAVPINGYAYASDRRSR